MCWPSSFSQRSAQATVVFDFSAAPDAVIGSNWVGENQYGDSLRFDAPGLSVTATSGSSGSLATTTAWESGLRFSGVTTRLMAMGPARF